MHVRVFPSLFCSAGNGPGAKLTRVSARMNLVANGCFPCLDLDGCTPADCVSWLRTPIAHGGPTLIREGVRAGQGGTTARFDGGQVVLASSKEGKEFWL